MSVTNPQDVLAVWPNVAIPEPSMVGPAQDLDPRITALESAVGDLQRRVAELETSVRIMPMEDEP